MSKPESNIDTTMSNEAYHANRTHVSSSGLKLYLKDPREYHKQYVLGEPAYIPPALQNAFDLGSYMHTMVLEPHLLEVEYAIFKSGDREAFDYDNEGKTIITMGQDSLAKRVMSEYEKAVFYPDGKLISTFFEDGFAEESFFTELDGLPIKVRSDYRKQKVDKVKCLSGLDMPDEFKYASINDVKTTSKAVNLKSVKKICEDLGYDISAALYIDAISKVTGVEHDFFFMFMGKKDYNCQVFRASKEFIKNGRDKYKKAIEGILKSRETGIWISEV